MVERGNVIHNVKGGIIREGGMSGETSRGEGPDSMSRCRARRRRLSGQQQQM